MDRAKEVLREVKELAKETGLLEKARTQRARLQFPAARPVSLPSTPSGWLFVPRSGPRTSSVPQLSRR